LQTNCGVQNFDATNQYFYNIIHISSRKFKSIAFINFLGAINLKEHASKS